MGIAVIWTVRVALWGLAIAAALLPMRAEFVERHFSHGVFPRIQTFLTAISNRVPFALFDVLLVLVVLWWLGALVVDIRRGRGLKRGYGYGYGRQQAHWGVRLVVRTVTLAAVAYLAFLVTWGLNYRRVPLRTAVAFDEARVSPSALRALVARSVDRMNDLYEAAHAEIHSAPTGVDPVLAAALVDVQRHLGATHQVTPARPKWTLLDGYFRRSGVAGMTDPYFLETFIASDLLPVERPFVVAHEWGHLAGYADESEASFIGWLTCLRGSALHQYSGWLFLYSEAASALGAEERRAAVSALADGPRDDLRAINDRLQRHVDPRVFAAWRMTYDRYLKANRVEAGVGSYAEVVTLVLGTEFDEDGRPVLRAR